MSWFSNYMKSSIGAKHVMAVSGAALVLFIIGHLAGNLITYAGQDAFNTYAATLKGNPALLWSVRVGLLVMVVLHIAAGLRLAALNAAARPTKYVVYKPRASTPFGRSMRWTGLVLFAFIVFHLLHFTVGLVMPEAFATRDPLGRHDAYTMLVLGFQNVAVSISYIVAVALLCMHLSHGASSMFQSLGLNHPKYNPVFRRVGPVLAIILFVGFSSIPVSVMAGIIKLPGA